MKVEDCKVWVKEKLLIFIEILSEIRSFEEKCIFAKDLASGMKTRWL